MRVELLLASLIALSGCETGHLINPSNPNANIRADGLACEREAAQTYPAAIAQGQEYDPLATMAAGLRNRSQGTINAQTTCMPGTTTCTTTGTYAPPQQAAPVYTSVSTDMNAKARENYLVNCLQAKGWRMP